MNEPHYLIRGIGGSHAHGLAHADSDHDYRGVFSYPTSAWWGLSTPKETITTSAPSPDSTAHELEKFLRLASKGNPDVLEVMALDTYIDFDLEWGTKLLALEPALLSTKAIRSAYMGYASQQFGELKRRGDSFSSSTKNRTWKHAKHMFRLMETGHRILTTGKIITKVNSPSWYLNTMGDMEVEDLIAEFEIRFASFKDEESVLPDAPDMDAINEFLFEYRKAHC